METEVTAEIQAAVDRAEQKMKTLGDPLEMFDHAYGELPPYLQAQKEELARELAAAGKESSDHGQDDDGAGA